MIAVSSSLLVPSKPARESPNAAVLKWYNHICNHLHPITCLCSRLEATQVHLWVLLPTLKGKWFILEAKMVGAVLKLVSSLPPYPPPPGIYTWILKRGNNFHMPLQRASQTECAVVTVCQATHDLQEWSLLTNLQSQRCLWGVIQVVDGNRRKKITLSGSFSLLFCLLASHLLSLHSVPSVEVVPALGTGGVRQEHAVCSLCFSVEC